MNHLDEEQLFEWAELVAESLASIAESLKDILEWMQR